VKDVLIEIEMCLEHDVRAVVATVVGTRGSTPGKETMRLVVREDGRMVGTIGGGCVEADVRDAAMATLNTGRTGLLRFDLTETSGPGRSGLICGGSVEIFLQPLTPDPCWAAARERRDSGARGSLVMPLGDDEPPRPMALLDETGQLLAGDPDLGAAAADLAGEALNADLPRRGATDTSTAVFVEPIALPMLWIHGGGHVSLELAEIASRAGFRVGVVDDREEFANPDRFPMAAAIVAAPFPGCLDRIPAGPRDHHVIVTRGHAEDETVLRWALARPAGSVGMIGSRRKVRTIVERLLDDGLPEDVLRRVRAPIGLDLGAATAPEIALSIAAELVAIRRLGADAEGLGHPLFLTRSPLRRQSRID